MQFVPSDWEPFSQIINSNPQITHFVPSIEASVLSDCTSFPQITQSNQIAIGSFELELLFVLSILTSKNSSCLNQGNIWLTTQKNGLSNSREQIAIPENEFSNSMERITNPWERITNPWEWIAQFVITIYLWLFFENPHVPSGLSYCAV